MESVLLDIAGHRRSPAATVSPVALVAICGTDAASPVETCKRHGAGTTVAASPMAAFVRSGVAMAEVGDDEAVTLLFARNDRPERPSIGRLCAP
ncbi:MAG TPA: hypothetical protein VGF70_11055 [Solirubrobacteraceae bacterium]|jgi:hypothetical protein